MPIYLEDKRLVKRLLAGNEQAFNCFFEENFSRIYRFVMARVSNDREAALENQRELEGAGGAAVLLEGREHPLHLGGLEAQVLEGRAELAEDFATLCKETGSVNAKGEPFVFDGVDDAAADAIAARLRGAAGEPAGAAVGGVGVEILAPAALPLGVGRRRASLVCHGGRDRRVATSGGDHRGRRRAIPLGQCAIIGVAIPPSF